MTRARPATRRAGARAALACAIVFGLLGASRIGHAAWISAKAVLAQVLIERAWDRNRAEPGSAARPWSWADTTPVARLRFERAGESMVVLSGDSGRILAFGPGHAPSTPRPATGGNSVISAHRDTHFALLRDIRDGDAISVETADGRTVRYVVDATRIVDVSRTDVMLDHGRDELTLVTCWPFDALRAGGRGRFVVHAGRTDDTMAQSASLPGS